MAHQSRVMLPSDRRAGDAAGFVPEVQERDARRERAPRARKTPVDGDNLSSPEKRKSSIRALAGQHPYLVAGLLALLAGLIILGIIWWLDARRFESTDDAFIDAHSVQISAQVSGAIVDIPVTDNQLVAAGAVLAKLDDRDYRAALAQAKGQVDQANANIENLGAQIEAQQARVDQAQKQVNEAQAAFKFAEEEDDRAQDLLRKGAGTAQRAQQTASDLRQRQAALAAARANYIAAEKQILVLKTQQDVSAAQLEQARAAQDQAQANLARTTIRAPLNGRTTKMSAAKGAYAQPGQALMMFVPQDLWITANFKETQLTYMHPRQPVSITIDAYPGRVFHGHVDSIQAGSGAAFSLLPPENATGNYVKVVQRVPVKIVFEETPDVYVGPGMSVVPQVQVR